MLPSINKYTTTDTRRERENAKKEYLKIDFWGAFWEMALGKIHITNWFL